MPVDTQTLAAAYLGFSCSKNELTERFSTINQLNSN
ncbi:hypothetical protein B6N60_02658 [Richelia sinica FACHB-800]|uniref:Uncharacterized protein n=1 Tax=Richelia sinica FACHB-800 TaxID=1357546 RepID=A0A975Y579_9NOST|nr:hypothetical protein B6N60_02658 [Richelia sinica FACHB-800]